MNQKEREIKSEMGVEINLGLLAVAFTIFALIASLNPSLLKESFLVPIQLTVAIPFLLSAIFARSKMAYATNVTLWENYGSFTFLVGYSFLINVLGILLAFSIGLSYGLIFFSCNILISIAYSILASFEEHARMSSRIKKDLFFILLLLLGGILPALAIY